MYSKERAETLASMAATYSEIASSPHPRSWMSEGDEDFYKPTESELALGREVLDTMRIIMQDYAGLRTEPLVEKVITPPAASKRKLLGMTFGFKRKNK